MLYIFEFEETCSLQAFEQAGVGGWKLQGLVKPNSSLENYAPT